MRRLSESIRITPLVLVLCVALGTLGGICQAEVFFLRDGSCLAGSSPRPLDDHFIRIQTLEGIADFERSEILIHRSDMELKKLCKKMRAELTPGSSSEMAQLAWWCRTKGLYVEMFDLLDSALDVDAQDSAVKKFVDQMVKTIDYGAFRALPHRGELDPALELFRASAAAGPTLGRIGEGILSQLPEDLQHSFVQSYRQPFGANPRETDLRFSRYRSPFRKIPAGMESGCSRSVVQNRLQSRRSSSVNRLRSCQS